MIKIEEVMTKMIAASDANLHDITHFLKVWAYAHTIGTLEKLDEDTQYTLEIAAIIHDIACPVCREKYGNTNGKMQENESPVLVEAFLKDMDMQDNIKQRVNYLVSHHHTVEAADGIDYTILLEADYLVNAQESGFSKDNMRKAEKLFFKTENGKKLLQNMFALSVED